MVADFLRLSIEVKKNQKTTLNRAAKSGDANVSWAVQPDDWKAVFNQADWTVGKLRVDQELFDINTASRVFSARRMPGCLIGRDERIRVSDHILDQLTGIDQRAIHCDGQKLRNFSHVVKSVLGS